MVNVQASVSWCSRKQKPTDSVTDLDQRGFDFYPVMKHQMSISLQYSTSFYNKTKFRWRFLTGDTDPCLLASYHKQHTWWRHQMDTFSALLALCVGNSPVTGEFPAQRPVTRRLDVFFGLRLNQQLSKQWKRRWFETPSRSLWCHCNELFRPYYLWDVIIHVHPCLNFNGG